MPHKDQFSLGGSQAVGHINLQEGHLLGRMSKRYMNFFSIETRDTAKTYNSLRSPYQ
jgi:hypothetical protein